MSLETDIALCSVTNAKAKEKIIRDGNRVMHLIQVFWISLMALSEVWTLKYRYYKSRRMIIWQWKL